MSDDNTETHKKRQRRAAELESARTPWEDTWRTMATQFSPRRSRFLTDGTNDGQQAKAAHRIVDSTGRAAVKTLAAGMQSGLTSPARPWFRLALAGQNTAGTGNAKQWLHFVQERITAAFASSTFYDCVHSLYAELGVFGTGCLFLEEGKKTALRFRTMTAGEYWLDNSADGTVDTVLRVLQMTPRQILEDWPESCPERIKSMVDKGGNVRFAVSHLVAPNPDYDEKRHAPTSRPWRSTYWLREGGKEVLEESGYYVFPFMCPRWERTGDDVYGTSPGMDALGDGKMLQKMRRTGLESLEKEVNPPLQVPSSLSQAGINVSPGAINYVSPFAQGQQAITPLYQVRANLPALEGTVADFRRQIDEAFYKDLFKMLAGMDKSMTAMEVAARNAEKMQLLGPVLDRLNNELFSPLIDRAFDILLRAGHIPRPPQELQGMELKIEFVSILAQAQKAAGIAAVEQYCAFTGQLAAANPQVLDNVNYDAAATSVAEMLGVPPTVVRSPEEVAQLRAQREQQLQQQQQMQMLQQGAGMAGQVAKAAKDMGITPEAMQGVHGGTQ